MENAFLVESGECPGVAQASLSYAFECAFLFLTATENEKARILSTCRGFTLHKAALKRITSKLLTATVQNNVGLSVGESQDLCLRIKSEWKGRLF